MPPRLAPFLGLLLVPLLATPAAAGAWASFARPYHYAAPLVQGDTVWCGSLEAGLYEYLPGRAPDPFVVYRREPGGLSSNRITSLAIERSRRLWVGTDGAGASRLSADRASWDLVSAFDGLPEDSVTVLAAQGDSMWIGTSKGFALWDGRQVAGAIPDGVDPSPFGNDHVTGIVPLGDSLWVSTLAGVYVSRISSGFQSWSIDTVGFRRTLFGTMFPIDAMVEAGGTLLALQVGAVFRFDPSDGKWKVAGTPANIGPVMQLTGQHGVGIASTAAPDPPNGVSPGLWRWVSGASWQQVSSTLVSPQNDDVGFRFGLQYRTGVAADGGVWALNGDGLVPPGAGAPIAPATPPGNDVLNLWLQGDSLYVNTSQEGFGRYDLASGRWRDWPVVRCGTGCDTSFTIPIYLFALLGDRRGHKWAGSWGFSLDEFDDTVSPPVFVHHTVDEPVPDGLGRHTFAWAAIEDQNGGHWFGLDSNGLTDPTTALGIDYYDSTGAYVRNFRPDNTGGAMQGSQIRAILRTAERGLERIFIGYSVADHGMDYVDNPGPLTATSVPSFQRVTAMARAEVIGLASHGDSLWALTTQDVERLSVRSPTDVLESYSKPGSAAENSVHPLDVGPDGTVWIGSENGLRAIHPGGRAEDFTVRNSPLLENRVRAIRVDRRSGVVWIGSGGGVNRFDPGYVPPGDTIPAHLVLQAFPNPASITALGVSIRLRGNGTHYRVDVIDVRGRRVRRLDGVTNDRIFWDARDDSGTLVRPGIYFLRVETGGRTATARVTLIR